MERRTKLQQQLEEVERHIAEGEHHIIKQETQIAELERDGHDTRDARRILDTFRLIQEQRINRRGHILRELEN